MPFSDKPFIAFAISFKRNVSGNNLEFNFSES